MKSNERAQVGIGTLIIFIAMVLVAALAAGVLINTVGFLQIQSEQTGTESTEQVSDNIKVITTVGNVSGNNIINEIRIGVQPAGGAGDINLAELSLQYVSDDQFANVVIGNDSGTRQATGDSAPGDIGLEPSEEAKFLLEPVTAADESDVVMTDRSDRYEIVIPLDDTLTTTDYPVYDNTGADVSNGNADVADQGGLPPGLSAGDMVEIRITTEIGAQTVAVLQVPDSLASEDTGTNINL